MVAADGVVAGPAGPLDTTLHQVVVDPQCTVRGRPGAARGGRSTGIEMVGALPTTHRVEGPGATVKANGDVVVALAAGASLVLGSGDDVEQKFIAAQSLLGGSVVLSCLRTADVSVPSAPVIERGAGMLTREPTRSTLIVRFT